MATVNFSVPDEVKETFDKTFGDQNKSAIIADLMRRAVREHQLQIRREQLYQCPCAPRVGNGRANFQGTCVRSIMTVVLDGSVILKWLLQDPASEPDTDEASRMT
jgi:hypothetical protein